MRSFITPLDRCDWPQVRGLYTQMLEEAQRVLSPSEGDSATMQLGLSADMRFSGRVLSRNPHTALQLYSRI
ncbi:MAG: hypothetical protein ACRDJC_02940 [Thermomicrobiales bacterium]